ncbi:TPA: hypothetical protein U1C23_002166 [Streptococcus suis]|uniref:hypothetical protein n=1 Tax=Streptococcus suis TaxID=1307 RepID=UPI001ABE8622|nr:hypothetical protein [Streptococcus suis]MBO4110695.1 hypothetical protein [Streptococcus suis]HEM3615281.1 hypothetical protein [Streptococcus suis]HEM3635132.1 hypothetical protein [Streptococcus suis]
MKIKHIAIILLSIIIVGLEIPSISAITVHANSIDTIQTTNNLNEPVALSEDKINAIVNDVHSKHLDVSEEWIREVVYRQINGDYSIPREKNAFRSAWQGITVGQMGALLDTAISVALGGATGGLAALIKVKGKHAVQSAIRSAISQYLGSWFVNSVALDFVMNLLSPGTYIAQLWDSRDAVPNNGRINF